MRLALPSLWIWATRDALRRPGEALLSGIALASLVAVLSGALLLAAGLSSSSERVLRQGPSLVVRRVGPGGWAPMPLAALKSARGVRGVVRASARCWGLARTSGRTVTILAAPEPGAQDTSSVLGSPAADKAVVGAGLGLFEGDFIELQGAMTRTFEVERALPESAGLVAHDLVVLAPQQARELLGVPPHSASDLAIWVFHESEVDAIRPDLSAAFSFPVKITTMRESLGATRARIERAAGVRAILLIPALLALALLTLAATRIQLGARRDIGLLKSLGWTSGDVVRLHVFRALVIALPATALGWIVAYGAVFVWGARWAGPLLFGWTTRPPPLTLAPGGALLTLLEVGGLILAPWLAAVALPALRSAVTDPEQWLHGEEA